MMMKTTISHVRGLVLFRAAMMAPIAIMLIFSFFNLSAPLDPVRAASAFRLGIVNEDTGLAFPPIKVSDQVMKGLAERMPFTVVPLDNMNAARSALEAGDIATILHFPRAFSEQAKGTEPVQIGIVSTQNLTVAESQIAAQLPMTVQLAMSAGIANLRSALASGRMPSMDMPVQASVEVVHPAPTSTAIMAPNVMVFTTWLAALVGALLMVLATRKMAGPVRVRVRIAAPIVGLAIASLGLALVIGWVVGMEIFFPVWLSVWGTALCLHWFMGGLMALLTPLMMILLVPLVFYQSVVGGTMMPLAAAPDWLAALGGVAPFEEMGRGFRALVFGQGADLPWVWIFGAGALGLALHVGAGALRPEARA